MLVGTSVLVALVCMAAAVLLIVVPSGHIGWRVAGAIVLAAVAIDSADFVVLAIRGPAVRLDREAIEFFKGGRVPWTAVRSSSLIDDGRRPRLVVIANVCERWIRRVRWARPRSRTFRDGRLSVSIDSLDASPTQVVEAFERCG